MAKRAPDEPLLVLGASREAAMTIIRRRARNLDDFEGGALFGAYGMTLGRLLVDLAMPRLASRGMAPAGHLSLQALCARLVHRLADSGLLGRYAPLAKRPGLPTALASTFNELRMAEVRPADLPDSARDLRRLYGAYIQALETQGLADRATMFQTAIEAIDAINAVDPVGVTDGETDSHSEASPAEATHPVQTSRPPNPLGLPTLLVDVEITSRIQARAIRAIARHSPDLMAVVPYGDRRGATLYTQALNQHVRFIQDESPVTSSLQRVQRQLFDEATLSPAPLRNDVMVFSAAGESLECVEIARRILAAARDVAFDQIAVLLRDPAAYRGPLSEALRRAGIPAWFGPGVLSPHPAGRALLALLACASERLSARRFAEYLSLGEAPSVPVDTGAPPPAAPSEERFAPPDADPELWARLLERLEEDDPAVLGSPNPSHMTPSHIADEEPALPVLAGQAPHVADTKGSDGDATDDNDASAESGPATTDVEPETERRRVVTPSRWESLLGEAAVIGGRDRWQRRLKGLAAQLQLTCLDQDVDEVARERAARTLKSVSELEAFALPLIGALSELPEQALWGEWLESLSKLASRALRDPSVVQAVLTELAPLSPVGPVGLEEVRMVLGERLTHLLQRPQAGLRRAGRVYVGEIGSARGMTYKTVFAPGLCERRFPRKVTEDPVLLDRERQEISPDLATGPERIAAERLQLRLAVGAASDRFVFSYPRIDLEQARPRVPSFYGLEILRAAEGRLPDFADLSRRAGATTAGHRVAWPAPPHPEDAIDAAEYDLALLETLIKQRSETVRGRARYMVEVNPHLERALRFRARRWSVHKLTEADGLVDVGATAREYLKARLPNVMPYSATSLQNLAVCPYRFFLHTVLRLSPRETPEAIETLPARERGSLIHEVQFEVLTRLKASNLLPITEARLETAWAMLDQVVAEVAATYREMLAPAVERVWDEGVTAIRADLRQWMRLYAKDFARGKPWVPWRFELGFGIQPPEKSDPASTKDPVALDCGLLVKGAIDLVEVDPETRRLRATDHKSGRPIDEIYLITRNGRALQPLLYALALEKLEPDYEVEVGRLYYCTEKGNYAERVVPLDQQARIAAQVISDALYHHLNEGFFPAIPREDACRYCDFVSVCGPNEEARVANSKKRHDYRMAALHTLRQLK